MVFVKLCILLLSLSALNLIAKDKYNSFEELKAQEEYNKSYRIELQNRHSETSIFAIHGGSIENGTSEITKLIAGDKFNYYSFEGLLKNNAFSLHITSSRFDEPSALIMANSSRHCLSIHGYIGDENLSSICIGGGNEEKTEKFTEVLKKSNLGAQIVSPCLKYPGKHKNNIINRCLEKGVQLELSQKLRDELLKDDQKMNILIQTIRGIL